MLSYVCASNLANCFIILKGASFKNNLWAVEIIGTVNYVFMDLPHDNYLRNTNNKLQSLGMMALFLIT